MPDVSGWERFAMGLPATLRSSVRARGCASYPAIPQVSGRSRFHPRTDNKVPAAAHLCSVPTGAGKADDGGCDKVQKSTGGSLPRPARSGRLPAAATNRSLRKPCHSFRLPLRPKLRRFARISRFSDYFFRSFMTEEISALEMAKSRPTRSRTNAKNLRSRFN